jgi:hypothetical protein
MNYLLLTCLLSIIGVIYLLGFYALCRVIARELKEF